MSISPGTTVRPRASITRVDVPTLARTSSTEPTATNFPSSTASAAASWNCSSTVRIFVQQGQPLAEVAAPVFHVYADESGKTQTFLVVGTPWVLEATKTLRLSHLLRDFEGGEQTKKEFHFTEIDKVNVETYQGFMEVLLANAGMLILKYIAVENAGGPST